ncbi:hypothetical protein ACLOJK_011688 [Asimina triloba]
MAEFLPIKTIGTTVPSLKRQEKFGEDKIAEKRGIKTSLATTLFLSNSAQFNTSLIGIQTISDGCDQGGFNQAGSLESYLESFKAAGSQTLAELIKKLDTSGHGVTCLVYDGLLPWPLDVAKQFDILAAAFFTQSCTIDSIYYHVFLGTLSAPLEVNAVTLPGLPSLQISDLPSFFSPSGFCPSSLPLVLNPFTNLNEVDWILLNTFNHLEAEIVDWVAMVWPAKTIGPTLSSMFLDKQLHDDTDYSFNLVKPDSSTASRGLTRGQQVQSSMSHSAVGPQ